MATFKAYPNGATMGTGNPAPTGGLRGRITGWSPAAVRRHKRWLYSVEAPELTGYGEAVTLTLRTCPDSAADWMALLNRLFKRLDRAGMVRWHWVVEWQRRMVPHVHMAIYEGDRSSVDPLASPGRVAVSAWLEIAAAYGPQKEAQFVTPISGPVGWLKYLSKHASRGVKHYQRQGKPAGWETTGRLWGYGGQWPCAEPLEGHLSNDEMWRVRRMVRGWAVAEARARNDWQSVRYLRRMLRSHDRMTSAVRGVSEWVPGPIFVRMAVAAGWSGEMPD